MRYWLTMHWPRIEDETQIEGETLFEDIYIQAGRQVAGSKAEPGNRVLIYETKRKGPLLVKENGKLRSIRRKEGRCGIVAEREVTTRPEHRPETTPTRFLQDKNGKEYDWEWCAKTKLLEECGFAPFATVYKIMGPLRSGLREVTPEKYRALLEEFKRNPPEFV